MTLPGWPIAPEKAKQLQRDLGTTEMNVDLGGGAAIQLKKLPAGEFVMGDVEGYGNEYPTAAARIEKPFWIGATEVSLAQYQQFDPNHRNGYYDMHYKDQVKPGYLMDSPDLPVIRVSWDQAMAFCQWLSTRTGKKVSLPTEAQWEWSLPSRLKHADVLWGPELGLLDFRQPGRCLTVEAGCQRR